MRDELEITQDMIDILEDGGMELICYAKPPFPEDTFFLGSDLIDQLREKRKIMLAHWTDIESYLTTEGDTIPGPYGTPSILIENGKWHLFYERNDEGVWLAVSDDHLIWTNVQDEPVLKKGPDKYDSGAVAANQVIKFKNLYYMYYHGTSDAGWSDPGAKSIWISAVAMSADLIHWTKYPGNPIVEGDHSSPIMVYDGDKYRLYTMHNQVWLYDQN